VSVYPFIEAEQAQQRTVKRACELLEVSRAAYYAHGAGTVSMRQRTDAELTEHIRQAHQASKGRYGAHASMPSFAAAAVGTGGSGSPACCVPPVCVAAPHAGGSAPRSPTRQPPPGRT
jgi:hypothetical protein